MRKIFKILLLTLILGIGLSFSGKAQYATQAQLLQLRQWTYDNLVQLNVAISTAGTDSLYVMYECDPILSSGLRINGDTVFVDTCFVGGESLWVEQPIQLESGPGTSIITTDETSEVEIPYLYPQRMFYQGGTGDVNGSGSVSSTDAQLISLYLDGVTTLVYPYEADVDGDGVVTNTDRFIVFGMGTTYPNTYIFGEFDQTNYNDLKLEIGKYHSGLNNQRQFNVREDMVLDSVKLGTANNFLTGEFINDKWEVKQVPRDSIISGDSNWDLVNGHLVPANEIDSVHAKIIAVDTLYSLNNGVSVDTFYYTDPPFQTKYVGNNNYNFTLDGTGYTFSIGDTVKFHTYYEYCVEDSLYVRAIIADTTITTETYVEITLVDETLLIDDPFTCGDVYADKVWIYHYNDINLPVVINDDSRFEGQINAHNISSDGGKIGHMVGWDENGRFVPLTIGDIVDSLSIDSVAYADTAAYAPQYWTYVDSNVDTTYNNQTGVLLFKTDVVTDRWALDVSNFYMGVGVVGDGMSSGGGNVMIGNGVGRSAINNYSNTAIGYNSLPFGGMQNTAVGYLSLGSQVYNLQANTAVGSSAGENNGGNYNAYFGSAVGLINSSGSNNTSVGTFSFSKNVSGSNNTLLGYLAGDSLLGSGNVIIGNEAGGKLTSSNNKLYIENSNSSKPLIEGDFSKDSIAINGSLTVTDRPNEVTAHFAMFTASGQLVEADTAGFGGGGGDSIWYIESNVAKIDYPIELDSSFSMNYHEWFSGFSLDDPYQDNSYDTLLYMGYFLSDDSLALIGIGNAVGNSKTAFAIDNRVQIGGQIARLSMVPTGIVINNSKNGYGTSLTIEDDFISLASNQSTSTILVTADTSLKIIGIDSATTSQQLYYDIATGDVTYGESQSGGGDNLGNHQADTSLNMDGNNINNVDTLTTSVIKANGTNVVSNFVGRVTIKNPYGVIPQDFSGGFFIQIDSQDSTGYPYWEEIHMWDSIFIWSSGIEYADVVGYLGPENVNYPYWRFLMYGTLPYYFNADSIQIIKNDTISTKVLKPISSPITAISQLVTVDGDWPYLTDCTVENYNFGEGGDSVYCYYGGNEVYAETLDSVVVLDGFINIYYGFPMGDNYSLLDSMIIVKQPTIINEGDLIIDDNLIVYGDVNVDTNDINNIKTLNLTATTDSSGYITIGGSRTFHTFGLSNTFAGPGSGNFTTTATQNVGVGNNSLKDLTDGNGNTAVGYTALTANTSGPNNTAIGQNSLVKHESGEQNVGVGSNSLMEVVTGSHNTGIGTLALQNTTGSNNVALGYSAGHNYLGSYRLFVDSEPFNSEEEDSIKSLLFGNFLTDKLTVNGDLNVTENITGTFPSSILEWADTNVSNRIGVATYDDLVQATTTYYFDPDASIITNGTSADGNVNSLDDHEDGSVWQLNEQSGIPGYDVEIVFDSVDKEINRFQFRGYYDGSVSHTVAIQVWDYEDSDWETYTTLSNRASMEWLEITLPDPDEHKRNDSVRMRFYHSESGVPSHRLYIDYVSLMKTGGGSLVFTEEDPIYASDSANIIKWPDTTMVDGIGITTYRQLADTAAAIRADMSGGPGGWVGTAESDLNMMGYNIDSVGRIGIGTDSPAVTLDIIHQESTTTGAINIAGYYSAGATAGQTLNRVARGTVAFPTAIQLNDIMGGFAGRGYGATAFSGSARVQIVGGAAENWTDVAQGTFARISTTPIGSVTQSERMRVTGTGVGINTTFNDMALEINSSTGNNLRLTYNDADGTAANKVDLTVSSGGDLTVTPSGGDVTITGTLTHLSKLPKYWIGIDTTAINTTAKYFMGYTPSAIVLDTIMYSMNRNSGSPDVTVKLWYGTDMNSAGTAIVLAGNQITTYAGQTKISTFTNGTIPAGNVVWATFSAVALRPKGLFITLIGH